MRTSLRGKLKANLMLNSDMDRVFSVSISIHILPELLASTRQKKEERNKEEWGRERGNKTISIHRWNIPTKFREINIITELIEITDKNSIVFLRTSKNFKNQVF